MRYNKLWTWTVSPQNSYAEALITSVTVFGNRTHKQVVKVKWGHKGKPSSDRPGVLIIKWERDQGILSLSLSTHPMHTQRSHMNTQQGVQETSEWNLPCWNLRTLISEFRTPELWDIHFYCWSHAVYSILLWHPEQTKTHHFCFY